MLTLQLIYICPVCQASLRIKVSIIGFFTNRIKYLRPSDFYSIINQSKELSAPKSDRFIFVSPACTKCTKMAQTFIIQTIYKVSGKKRGTL